MAFETRGRRVAYDNIARASATGRERVILAETPSTELVGGGLGSSTMGAGTDAKGYSNPANALSFNDCDPTDNLSVGVVTLHGERLG